MQFANQTRDLGIVPMSIPYQFASAKKTIARQGEVGDHCYLVTRGVLSCCVSASNGKRQIVGFHVAGDICGQVASFTGPSDYSIEALSDVTFVPIQTRSLSDLVQASLPLESALRRHINVDAAISRQWILNLGQRPAYHRLAHLICEIEARLRAVGLADNGMFKWHGTQSDIGAATGLSLVHTNKMLAALERDGLVAWRGRVVRIDDLARLRKVAEFDPAYLSLDQQSLGDLLLLQGASRHGVIHGARQESIGLQTEPQSGARLTFAQTIT